MNRQPQCLQPGLDLSPPGVERPLVVGEQKKVVHVADVCGALEFPFDEVIERIQVDVSPELGRLITDGQAARSGRRQQVVAGEPALPVLIGQDTPAAVNDLRHQPTSIVTGDVTPKDGFQDIVVDGLKERLDIGLKNIGIAAGERLRPIEGAVGTLANPIGVAVVDEHALVDRLNEVAQSVMNDAIAERSGADLALLGVVAGAAEDYLGFLNAGGSRYPLEALRAAGVDLTQPEPVETAFEVLSGLIDQLEGLVL